MRYSPEVRQFWYIGKRLFHGKFLQFMRGPGNQGTVVSDTTRFGSYNPQESQINFAVPADVSIPPESTIPESMLPGLLHPLIDQYFEVSKTASTKSHNLCCDLNKINASKVSKLGCINLSGFEKSPTKEEIDDRLSKEMTEVTLIIECVKNLLGENGDSMHLTMTN